MMISKIKTDLTCENKKIESKVLVLLSTYNGEQYIREQIDSILMQKKKNINISILIRDDGSLDRTLSIIDEYIKNGVDIKLLSENNIGAAQSFRKLIKYCDMNYDFYALADQDDIWNENKLEIAVSCIKKEKEDIPILWYCGLSYLIDNTIKGGFFCPESRANNIETVLNTFSTTNGCTMVFNRNLMHILKKAPDGDIDMHDSWINAVCLASNGRIIGSPERLVLYRIHETQLLGNQKKFNLKTLKKLIYPSKRRYATIITLSRMECVNEQFNKYMHLLASYKKNKIRIIFKKKPIEMQEIEYVKFIIQILLNRY